MGFGCKMNDGIHLVFAQHSSDLPGIANIALHKGMFGGGGQAAQVFQAAGIGEQVEVDDVNFWGNSSYIVDEVGASEPGPAGDQQFFYNGG